MSTNARFIATGATVFTPGQDNTARTLDHEYLAPAYAASIALKPTKSQTLVKVGDLTGALSITAGVGTSTTPPYVGDKLKVLFTSAAGATVTLSTGFLFTAATIVIPAGKTANANFMFNGTSWVEESRAITA